MSLIRYQLDQLQGREVQQLWDCAVHVGDRFVIFDRSSDCYRALFGARSRKPQQAIQQPRTATKTPKSDGRTTCGKCSRASRGQSKK